MFWKSKFKNSAPKLFKFPTSVHEKVDKSQGEFANR